MSLHKPLEGLLRPPVEWYASAAALTAAGLLLSLSQTFILDSSQARLYAWVLTLFALWRFKQGFRVWRYQRRLKHLPVYALSSQQLPVSGKRLFLGLGFQWTVIHTQRLRDLDLPYNLAYKMPSRLYQWTRSLERRHENTRWLAPFMSLMQKDSVFNPVWPYPDIGGEPCLHGVSDGESDIALGLNERGGHALVIGTTGVGKTRLAELLIAQDIRRGDVVIVLDPKGDTDLLLRIFQEAALAGRKDDLLMFHLGFPDVSCRYNPIGHFTRITQVAARVANALPSTREAAAFKEFAWKYVNLVARALRAMQLTPTYQRLNFYITQLEALLIRYCEETLSQTDPHFSAFIDDFTARNMRKDKQGRGIPPAREEAVLAYVKDRVEFRKKAGLTELPSDLLADLAAACRLDRTYYDKITASVGPLLEKLTTRRHIAGLLSSDASDREDKRPVFNWQDVIRHKKIVYAGMDALTDSVVSSTVGNAMLSDLVSMAGHLYKFGLNNHQTPLPRICLHADEFNEIIGDEFIPLLNKARGAGFNVTAYTQTWSDVEARLNSKAKAGQAAGNLNAVIMFRTKEAATVDRLLNQLPAMPILRPLPASSSTDSHHGEDGKYYSAANEDRLTQTEMPLISQNDVLNLPKGQAFCLLEGGKLYKIRVPLPKLDASEKPFRFIDLIEQLRADYGRKTDELNERNETH